MIQLCKQGNPRDVRRRMNALPSGAFATFENAMKRIEEQQDVDSQLAKRALSYIFCARRPLKLEELRHVLAVEGGDTALDATAFVEPEILLNISAGLIRIDEQSGTVGLVHYTLREYFERNLDKLLPDPDVEMAKACLTYMSYDVFGRGPCSNGEELNQRLQEYQFLDYASHYCGYHIMGNQLHVGVVDLLSTFLKDEQKLSSFVQVLHVPASRVNDGHDRFPKQFTTLHVVAYWGLDKILINLPGEGINAEEQDSFGTTPLHLAASHGHISVMKLLLGIGANLNIENKNGETALYWAARNGHKAMVNLLLKNKARVLTKDKDGWTALDWTVVGGNNDVLEMLLNGGDDTTADKSGRNKALFLAAEEGHDTTVQMLIDHGANINAQDHLGSTALDFAAPPGNEKTVQLLLQNEADVKSRDVFGNTILHWSVPHKALVQLLLKHGIDIDAKNDNGQTALSWAAQDAPVAVAELLIENNADVNIRDKFGFTALHRASLRGHEVMVTLLLESGANPNIMDEDGWTSLHVAALRQQNHIVQFSLGRVDDGRAVLDWVSLQVQDTRNQALLGEIMEKKAEASTQVTGLREAIQEKQLGRSQVLIDKGADVNGKDVGGWTALIIAAW